MSVRFLVGTAEPPGRWELLAPSVGVVLHGAPREEWSISDPPESGPDTAGSISVMSGLVIALIVLAVIFGVIGLVVEALQWMLIIAGLLLVVGLVRIFITSRMDKSGSTRR